MLFRSTVHDRFHDACGHGTNFTPEFSVHVYGGNVPDALAYPQWRNTGQVLLKVENHSEKKKMIQLRTMPAWRKVYVDAERVHVRDGAEAKKNFTLLSKDLFVEDEDKEHVDLCVLNEAKFRLNRKPSKLKDFRCASSEGQLLCINEKSLGPSYFLLRLTSGCSSGGDSGLKLDLTMAKQRCATYFHVNDVDACIQATTDPKNLGFA